MRRLDPVTVLQMFHDYEIPFALTARRGEGIRVELLTPATHIKPAPAPAFHSMAKAVNWLADEVMRRHQGCTFATKYRYLTTGKTP